MADLPAIIAAGENSHQLVKREGSENINRSWVPTQVSFYITEVCHPVEPHATRFMIKIP